MANCTICLQPLLTDLQVATKCGHVFHKECIHKWLDNKKVCPNCNIKLGKAKSRSSNLCPLYISQPESGALKTLQEENVHLQQQHQDMKAALDHQVLLRQQSVEDLKKQQALSRSYIQKNFEKEEECDELREEIERLKATLKSRSKSGSKSGSIDMSNQSLLTTSFLIGNQSKSSSNSNHINNSNQSNNSNHSNSRKRKRSEIDLCDSDDDTDQHTDSPQISVNSVQSDTESHSESSDDSTHSSSGDMDSDISSDGLSDLTLRVRRQRMTGKNSKRRKKAEPRSKRRRIAR